MSEIKDRAAVERENAEGVINWLERVIYAVERADYQAADQAINIARMHLNVLQALSLNQETRP